MKQSELITLDSPNSTIIEFDGGTSCNIPRLGYGDGYGSYQISGRPVVRINHMKPMSSNVAEIMTAVVALDELRYLRGPTNVLMRGDSMITVNWIRRLGNGSNKSPKESRAHAFKIAVLELRVSIQRHKKVTSEWRSREHSVEIFGH